MRAPRVGLIGARRHRQGLGPYVARYLRLAGAEVPCLLGTSAETVAEGREQLQRLAGADARGYLDGESMLREEDLDALAILSPAGTHREWLELALEKGLHVLCEKPFVWDGDDELDVTRFLVEGFAERGLLLRENCQWPYTLPAFHTLHPELAGRRPARFAMRLSPTVRGEAMIGDSLPHPLSLLQCLSPGQDARVEEVQLSSASPDAAALDLSFRWLADGHATEVLVELVAGGGQPRQAGYCVDDAWAWRLVRSADYALFFANGARVVDVPDPLRLMMEGFVEDLQARLSGKAGASNGSPGGAPGAAAAKEAEPGRDPLGPAARIIQRVRALQELRRAFREAG